ncbi:uncharacterized protein K452DRAFT_316712 [Aplosporella prunicola CBS 121167]|uniref:Prenylcysteine lyase domain-containing protein n=1 Tax=Aplosporella prunicola CBS 121167 TaxID=1176127 RepID=A0A6A6BKZ2_9PEZI|nr:uncharacterized protein K452DRAFT_316712 [Aplosporella prunicola CBS 121167]KAF2144792.1 hypothetical protein K452DRAFT_316712 [Aplosporella prunicola CBS 121167]
MLLSLTLAAVCLPFSQANHHVENYQAHLSTFEDVPAKRVAIIGAGAGGSSAAYHISQYAAEANIPTNVTVFERSAYVGGRSMTVNVWDAPSLPVELGASIFVSVNKILVDAVTRFNLSTAGYDSFDGDAGTWQDDKFGSGDFIGIWNGDEFVFTGSDDFGWWDKTKLVWRYGLAPLRTVQLMKKTVGKFLEMYAAPHFPFKSLSDKAHELGLVEASAATGEEFLRKNGIGEKFAREVVQASTRVNYAQNLPMINGLITMVCMATDGAMAVAGGNWQIFANMLKASSNTSAHLNTTVSALTKQSDGSYTLAHKTTTANGVSTTQEERFDSVIIAAPYQFADLAITPEPEHVPDTVPYVTLHVTLFTSPHALSPTAFNLQAGARVPQVILTTLGADESPRGSARFPGRAGFFSISDLRRVRHPGSAAIPAGRAEHLYKVFSAEPLSAAFMAKILGRPEPLEDEEYELPETDVSWVYRKVWHSYPYEFPRVTFDEVRLDRALWYTGGIEPFISTMETSALMGRNVARLVVDEWEEEELKMGRVREGGAEQAL